MTPRLRFGAPGRRSSGIAVSLALVFVAHALAASVQSPAAAEPATDAVLAQAETTLATSRRPADLEAVLTSCVRAAAQAPNRATASRALLLSGEALRYLKRYDDALDTFARVVAEFPDDQASARAHFASALALAASAAPIDAMIELQRVRNRWPQSREAAEALPRLSILHRFNIRPPRGTAYEYRGAVDAPPARTANITALAVREGVVYYSTKSSVESAGGDTTTARAVATVGAPATTRPRGVCFDRSGHFVVLDGGTLRTEPSALTLTVTQGTDTRPLAKLSAAAQTVGGDWIVADEDQRGLFRFGVDGRYLGILAPIRVTRLAADDWDEIAAIDRDKRSVVVFDGDANLLATLPATVGALEMRAPVDIAFDLLGHLYVLDRAGVFVFSRTPTGTWTSLAVMRLPETGAAALRRPAAFALDATGRIYIADDRTQRIQIFD